MIRLPGEFFYRPLHFFSKCPLQIWTAKTSNKDILNPITASSLRFGQLKEDDE